MDKYAALLMMVACTTGGQLYVKKGAAVLVYGRGFRVLLRSFFNPSIFVGGVLIMFAPLFYFYALTSVDLRVAFSFTGLNYVFVFLGGWLMFKEETSYLHFAGVTVIVMGVLWFNL